MNEFTEVVFNFDGHEQARLAAILSAVGDELDLLNLWRGECDAIRMLYGNLSAAQRAVYQQLIDAGILNG